jgi:uncharacterized membrane protein (DUF4010 family)
LPKNPEVLAVSQNPLELGVATIFAVLFVLTSLLSTWVAEAFGIAGRVFASGDHWGDRYRSVRAQPGAGGASGAPDGAIAAAILIATSSNNLLKAVYAVSFARGRATAPSAAALVALALGGVAMAIHIGGG